MVWHESIVDMGLNPIQQIIVHISSFIILLYFTIVISALSWHMIFIYCQHHSVQSLELDRIIQLFCAGSIIFFSIHNFLFHECQQNGNVSVFQNWCKYLQTCLTHIWGSKGHTKLANSAAGLTKLANSAAGDFASPTSSYI